MEAVEEALLFAAEPVVLANVLVEAPDGELALFFAEPGRCTWKIGEEEECDEGDEDGDCAFDDEEPTPRVGLIDGSVVKGGLACVHTKPACCSDHPNH